MDSEPDPAARVCMDTVHTLCEDCAMAKVPASLSETALAERLPPAEGKGSINLRIEAETRRLIDDA